MEDWIPPPMGSLKVNFDVAIKSNIAVAAAILRDHPGDFPAASTKHLPSIFQN